VHTAHRAGTYDDGDATRLQALERRSRRSARFLTEMHVVVLARDHARKGLGHRSVRVGKLWDRHRDQQPASITSSVTRMYSARCPCSV